MTNHEGQIPEGEQGELDRLHQAQVAILDAGSQFCGQIDRTVRELDVKSDILPLETPVEELACYKAIIISGGPDSVLDEDARHCDPRIFESGVPTLGICYGMQEMAYHMGGEVGDSGLREDGRVNTVFFGSRLFEGISPSQDVWMSHGDSILVPPKDFRIVGGHDGDFVSAIDCESRKQYGVQFHPEVHSTPAGKDMIANFMFKISELDKDFKVEDQVNEARDEIRNVIRDKHVLMYLSGGVDSTVMAALVADTLEDPSKIHAFHIDHGFMREGEGQEVIETLSRFGINVEYIDASEIFLNATTKIDGKETVPLRLATHPQVKRAIIGDTFDALCDLLVEKYGLPSDTVLALGTIRPDLIESGSKLVGSRQQTIKTHHNDTERARKRREAGEQCEPLKMFYKDQVRKVGEHIGIPEEMVWRQPFPGPGEAIRMICETVSIEEQIETQEKVDNYLAKEYSQGLPLGLSAAEVLRVPSVGVQGEVRTYKPVLALRGGIADWPALADLTRELTNQKLGLNRVVYAFNDIAPSDMINVPYLDDELANKQIKHADAIVREEFGRAGLNRAINQIPVILTGASYGGENFRSVVIRTFITPDFMTGRIAVPNQDYSELVLLRTVERILREVPGISQVFYDLTDKPPGTTEWE